MSRNLLHKSKLQEFQEWLLNNHLTYRFTNAEFQVMQVYYKDHWQPIYDRIDAKEHYTVVRPLEPLVKRFIKESK